MWQRCIGNPRFYGGKSYHLLTKNRIKFKERKRAREKRRRHLSNLSEEILERSRGRRRRENFNENQRKVKYSESQNTYLQRLAFR